MTKRANQIISVITAVVPWLIATADAPACSPPPPDLSTSEWFARASTVFAARITKTEVSEAEKFLVEATLRIIEVFKGQPPADHRLRTMVFIPGACGYPLLAGVTYLLFLSEGQTHVSLNDGSVRGAFPLIDDPRVQELFAEVRALAK